MEEKGIGVCWQGKGKDNLVCRKRTPVKYSAIVFKYLRSTEGGALDDKPRLCYGLSECNSDESHNIGFMKKLVP